VRRSAALGSDNRNSKNDHGYRENPYRVSDREHSGGSSQNDQGKNSRDDGEYELQDEPPLSEEQRQGFVCCPQPAVRSATTLSSFRQFFFCAAVLCFAGGKNGSNTSRKAL
jgi:hypothetical protein